MVESTKATLNNDEEIETSLDNIEVEWERQLQLRRKRWIFCLSPGESTRNYTELTMTFNPLCVTLIDDDSAFRIGNYLKQNGSPVKKLELRVPVQTDSLTTEGAQAFIRCLKLSQDVELVLLLEHKEISFDSAWKVILAGVIDAVPSLDVRHALNDTDAYQIGTSLVGNTKLQKLSLNISNLTESGAQSIADGLHQAHIQKLELMSYAYMYTSPAEPNGGYEILYAQAVLANIHELFLCVPLEDNEAVALGHALVGNQSLQTLSILIGEGVTDEGASALANGLGQSHIVRLEMDGDKYQYHIDCDVEDIIYRHGIQRSQSIRHLSIGEVFNLNEIESFALCLPNLQSLEINLKFPNDEHWYNDIRPLFDDLRNATQLRRLKIDRDLRSCELVHFSTSVLPFLDSLTHLTFCGNLTCEECADLIDETCNEYNIDDGGNLLPVACSELLARGAVALGAGNLMLAVANHPCLRHLDLDGSTDIGFLGLSMIGFMLPFIRLTELNIDWLYDRNGGNAGDDEDGEVQCTRSAAHQFVVAGVQSNHHLHKLSLSRHFPPTAVEEINFKLAKNKFGPFISDDHLVFGVWSHILAKCQENIGLMFYLLREQPILLLRTADHE